MIEDIKFFGDKVYLLKDSKISSLEIENKLSLIAYSGQKKSVNQKVENLNLPYFSLAFFSFIFYNDQIPDEKELYDSYISLNHIKEESDKLIIKGHSLDRAGVENRMLRAYPSLIRDFHFFKLCQESNKFKNVKYSTRLDIYEGIDLMIEQNNLKFCVALFTKTRRAISYKKRKNENRHDYKICNQQIEIEVDLSVNNGKVKKVSNFILLTNEYISELENRIKSYGGFNR